jgi:hypothetical protein
MLIFRPRFHSKYKSRNSGLLIDAGDGKRSVDINYLTPGHEGGNRIKAHGTYKDWLMQPKACIILPFAGAGIFLWTMLLNRVNPYLSLLLLI